MKRQLLWAATLLVSFQVTGCSVVSTIAASNRIEDAKAANAGKQLVPKDGGTYLIPVGTESVSYLGSANTEWKINNTEFTQPRGSYSVISVQPGNYNVYGNKKVLGGGEASAAINIKATEVICFYVYNPVKNPARIESTKDDACDPILRALKQQNVVDKMN